MAVKYRSMGHAFLTAFSVMAGWIAEMLYMLFIAYIAVDAHSFLHFCVRNNLQCAQNGFSVLILRLGDCIASKNTPHTTLCLECYTPLYIATSCLKYMKPKHDYTPTFH